MAELESNPETRISKLHRDFLEAIRDRRAERILANIDPADDFEGKMSTLSLNLRMLSYYSNITVIEKANHSLHAMHDESGTELDLVASRFRLYDQEDLLRLARLFYELGRGGLPIITDTVERADSMDRPSQLLLITGMQQVEDERWQLELVNVLDVEDVHAAESTSLTIHAGQMFSTTGMLQHHECFVFLPDSEPRPGEELDESDGFRIAA